MVPLLLNACVTCAVCFPAIMSSQGSLDNVKLIIYLNYQPDTDAEQYWQGAGLCAKNKNGKLKQCCLRMVAQCCGAMHFHCACLVPSE